MLRHPYVYFEPQYQDHAGAEWARETFGTTGSPSAVVAVSGHRVRATTLSFAGQSIPIESCCGRGADVRSYRPEYELLIHFGITQLLKQDGNLVENGQKELAASHV